MDPINYQLNVQAPFQVAMQGYQAGAAVRNDQQAQQAQQLALQQQQRQQQLLNSLASNPDSTASDYARVMTAIPSIAEPLTKAWETKNKAQQESLTSDLLQFGSAISNGQPQVAADLMNQRADRMEAAAGAPTQESQAMRHNAQVVMVHPELALGTIQAKLAANPNGKDAAATLANLISTAKTQSEAPSDLLKKQAEASKAVTEAQVSSGVAPAKVAAASLENEKTAQDIEASKSQQQIATLNTQIAQANSETERGRLTLQRDELQQKLDQTKQAQATEIQSRSDTISNGLATVESILKNPQLEAYFTGAGTSLGVLAGKIPGTARKDLEQQIETLQSQQFLSQLAALKSTGNGSSGMGALSDSEGARLTKAIASLDINQSASTLKNQLGVIRASLLKAQAGIAANPQTPTAGGAFVLKHPVFGNVSEGDINRLMKNQPGATRQQIMDFLKSTGGK